MSTRVAVLTMMVMSVGTALYLAGGLRGQEEQREGEGLAVRFQDLHLTEAQEAKIADIRKECQPKIQEAAKDLAAVAKEEMEKARAVLTDDQRTKLQALQEERRERRGEGLAARIAHLRELDLTDAERAEMQGIRAEYRPKIRAAMKNMEGLLTTEQKQAREEALKAGKKHREVIAALNLTGDQKAKVEAVCKDVATLVREELEKMRDVLSAEQKAKLPELKDERRDRIRDRMVARIANFKDLNLSDDQKTQLATIRQEYRPKVHEAGNKLRAAVREELGEIVAAMRGSQRE